MCVAQRCGVAGQSDHEGPTRCRVRHKLQVEERRLDRSVVAPCPNGLESKNQPLRIRVEVFDYHIAGVDALRFGGRYDLFN